MKLDSFCNQVYVVALNEARIQAHEYITPEHFLYSALMFDVGREIIEKSGGDVEQIKRDLTDFFDEHIPKKVTESPIDSYAFMKMLEFATHQAVSSGKKLVQIGNVIVAIFSLSESFAAYVLLKNGVDKLKLLRVISHEIGEKENEGETGSKKNTDATFLKTYATNLTERAKQGLLDPLVGRSDILERTIQVLSRRLKNNPLHVGEPGVGKTAVVYGLAQKIAEGQVPKLLQDSQIFYIDIGNILAGTRYRGDFEERLVKLLEIILKTKQPIIYIDEVHTIVGAGAVSGGGLDGATILKPYLAKGDVRFIGSTTFDEYKKYFEKDKALLRRFQKIDILEPSISECIEIINGIKYKYEHYHNVVYTEEVVQKVCELTGKYMQDKFLPDKAIDVIDETGAFVKMHNKDKVITLKDIEKTIALMTKIPESSISADEINQLKNLEEKIKTEIFGQDSAIKLVVDAIKISRSGLNDSNKPVASLLFVGPTGVGKTEIARQVALNFGIKLTRFDMSEYQEKHSVARLIGSPPGYVGYEEGGLLTDEIRKTPHCVLLLDEIEKAHPDIYNILLQIMDYGSLTDNSGKKADFRNVIIIMTSNAGAKYIGKRVVGFNDKKEGLSVVDKEVERIFNPEFRNRLDAVVVFSHIDEDMSIKIANKALSNLSKRLIEKRIDLEATPEAISFIALKGRCEQFGAREIMRVVDNDIKKQLVDEILFGKLKDGGKVVVDVKNEKLICNINVINAQIKEF